MSVFNLPQATDTAEASGVDGALPALLAEAVRRGVEAGDGSASLTSLVARFRRA
ncbi:hypothetical protein [Streptomyces sp. NRRL WC-3742]|uniref:imine reductase family protein n=1 Tax=Streptomyces sp. NRRL WC-3742 TaxID=1463934 RepID=UPI00131C5639|nr:hypothetical protein [Streptomyces sp. NRRL WC-3742]